MAVLRKLFTALLILPAALAVEQYLYVGTYKFSPPLPTTNTKLSLSACKNFVIGPESDGFPLTVPDYPAQRAAITSPERPGYLTLTGSSTPGLYDLKWAKDKRHAVKPEFFATSCGCGGNCGGTCLVWDKDPTTDWVEFGAWVLDERVAGVDEWKVGWWNGTGVRPEGLTTIILWRSTFV